MPIPATAAATLTASLATIETHTQGLADAIATYDITFNELHREAFRTGGLNRQMELDAAFGPWPRNVALAARSRGLQVTGLFAFARSTGTLGPNWADRLVAAITDAAAKEAA